MYQGTFFVFTFPLGYLKSLLVGATYISKTFVYLKVLKVMLYFGFFQTFKDSIK